jgi:arsenate reductase (thioredoxin)
MTDPMNILILCTGNSARSILGEALINHLGSGRLRGFSAGSYPKGRVHPGALTVLARNGIAVEGASSKSWDVFTGPDAPPLHIVITVCDNAAGEMCPIFPGAQIKAHWGIEDPADAEVGAAEIAAFDKAYAEMHTRVEAMAALDLAQMDHDAIRDALAEIGRMAGATALAKGTK